MRLFYIRMVTRALGVVDPTANFKIGLQMTIPEIIAAVLGALFISGLAIKVAKPYIRVVLIPMGLFIIYRHIRNFQPKQGNMGKLKTMLLGFIASFLDVSVKGGWGLLGTPALILIGEESKKAVGVIEFTEPIISTVAVLTFAFIFGFEKFPWNTTLPMIIGGIILTSIAGILTSKMPRRVLGILIGVWLVAQNL